jgi:hypothetical protein
MHRLLTVHLPRLYLQRFPLLLAGFLLLYVPFSLFVVPAMFRSTLVLTTAGLALVTTLALLTASVVMTMRRAILLCGPARFGIDWSRPAEMVSTRETVAHLSIATPLIGVAAWLSATDGGIGAAAVLSVASGIAAATGLQLAALALYAWLVDANERLPDLILPGTEQVFRRLHQRPRSRGRLSGAVERGMLALRPWLGPGYLTATGEIEPAHLYATGVFVVFAIVYWVTYFIGKPQYDRGVPALVFVLLLVTLIATMLSGAAFLLDRFRLPTLLPIAAWVALLAAMANSDHYFRLRPTPSPLTAATPYQIARARGPVLTVIAVDGGGIQAAAWGATVLTRIEQEWRDFHRTVGLISGVSGGSVGTTYFVSALRADRGPTDAELEGIRNAATRASLSEAAWGFTYPDLWRALLPIFRFEKDRAWAMEQAWRRNFPPDQVPTLGHWMAGVHQGWMPAVALNATVVESGTRFAFATFDPPPEQDANGRRAWELVTVLNTYPRHDIDVPTAARLSATFPYVTPISTAWPEGGVPAWHYADGGYYDNTGMGVAMRWLDAAMRGRESEFTNRTIAFIRIRSSPIANAAAPKERAWAYELVGPVATLLNVRTAGQRDRAETELEFLRRYWCGQHINIEPFEFGFDLPRPDGRGMKNPPLSWQLTASEVADLNSAWEQRKNQEELKRYLALKTSTAADGCAAR